MPATVLQSPILRKWERPMETTDDLDWANLSAIDLSKFDAPGGKNILAEELRQAVHRDGFFAVTGSGFTDEEVNRQYTIAQAFFEQPLEEKNKPELKCDFSQGNFFGYRAANEKKIMSTDVLDNVESLNIPKFTSYYHDQPHSPFLAPFEREVKEFSERSWEVARKIFVLFAIILELPEDFFVSRHLYTERSEDHLRYMIYHPRTIEQDAQVQNTWSRSHTDFGSLTLLWSQNIAGLQIKSFDGSWKYVRPLDQGIICNVGDTLSFWSAGYLKSTIHRVIRPPPDQDHIHRLGLFYFVRPGDDAAIVPAPSPLLRRMGLISDVEEAAEPVKGLQYVRERVKNYHFHKDYANRTGQKFSVGNLTIDDQIA